MDRFLSDDCVYLSAYYSNTVQGTCSYPGNQRDIVILYWRSGLLVQYIASVISKVAIYYIQAVTMPA